MDGVGNVSLTDLNGKTILTKMVTDNENISISEITKGMYILKMITKEGTIERKVMKN